MSELELCLESDGIGVNGILGHVSMWSNSHGTSGPDTDSPLPCLAQQNILYIKMKSQQQINTWLEVPAAKFFIFTGLVSPGSSVFNLPSPS